MSQIFIPIRQPNVPSMPSVEDFTKKLEAAGESGRIVIADSAHGMPELVIAPRTFKDRVISCLKNLPLFKDSSLVKNHIENTKINNQKALGLFINALSKCYGAQPSRIAFESIFLTKKNIPLNQRTIRQLNDTAKDYAGRGAAMNYSRKISLNLWPYEHVNKCGHASLTLQNPDANKDEYFSWWPGGKSTAEGNPTKKAKLTKIFDILTQSKHDLHSYFNKRPGSNNFNYTVDKYAELGSSTREKLVAGENARIKIQERIAAGTWQVTLPAETTEDQAHLKSIIKTETSKMDKAKNKNNTEAAEIHKKTAEDLTLLLESKFQPRALQTKDESGDWGVVAQKIYFPMAGNTKIIDDAGRKKSTFVMFGLSEKDISKETQHVKNNMNKYAAYYAAKSEFDKEYAHGNVDEKIHEKIDHLNQLKKDAKSTGKEIGYSFLSDTNNCASMAVRVLRAGGADNFVDFPKMTQFGISAIKPDEQLAQYLKEVQQEIDQWNERSDSVLSKLDDRNPASKGTNPSRKKFPELIKNLEKECETLEESEKNNLLPILRAIKENAPNAQDDIGGITKKLKNLVISAEKILSLPSGKKQHSVAKKIEILQQQIFKMHQQNITFRHIKENKAHNDHNEHNEHNEHDNI